MLAHQSAACGQRPARRFDYWEGVAVIDTEKLPLMLGKLPSRPVFSPCYLGAV